MTKSLYQTDSYCQEFEGTVTALDDENHAIILDQTAFYPGGGGQPADRGTLSVEDTTYTIKRAQRVGNKLLHIVENDSALPVPGTILKGRIDWPRRYQLMRTHTAMHILCGVVFRDYGASVTGGDMEPLKGHLDFEFETMRRELVNSIEAAINEEMAKNHTIRVQILPREEAFQIPDLIRTKINLLPEGITEVRVVEIVELDLQADGGTHVRTTSEVGPIRITNYKSKGRINKRIYIEIDPEIEHA